MSLKILFTFLLFCITIQSNAADIKLLESTPVESQLIEITITEEICKRDALTENSKFCWVGINTINRMLPDGGGVILNMEPSNNKLFQYLNTKSEQVSNTGYKYYEFSLNKDLTTFEAKEAFDNGALKIKVRYIGPKFIKN